MSKSLFFILAVFTCIFHAAAQTGNDHFDYYRKIPVADLRQDLFLLRDSLEVRHPAFYRHTSKKELDNAFDKACAGINRPLTQTEFYPIAASFISKVGDIHTGIEPSDEALGFIAAKSALLPFDVRVISNQLFIASNNSGDSSIQTATKILSINNRTAGELLMKMKAVFSDEGRNETLKIRRVEQRFAFLYYLLFGYSPNFTLKLVKDNKMQTKTVDAQSFGLIREQRTKNQVKHPRLRSLFVQPPYLNLSIDDRKGTAILTLTSFEDELLKNTGQDFKRFIDSAFNEMSARQTRNLIIDVRNNEGGQSANATYLYSYLAAKPFPFLKAMEATPKTFRDDNSKGVRYDSLNGRYSTSDKSTGSPQFFGFGVQPEQSKPFTGNLYVLVNGLTTSAAPQFASLVRLNKRGVIIGEQVPGSLYGGSGRGYSYFYLPNSGLLTMVSHYRLYFDYPRKGKDSVIQPDYKPDWSIDDILNGKDKDVGFALQLIEMKSRR